MDFSRFQKSVLLHLKEQAVEEGYRLELLRQHPYVIYNALRLSGRFSRENLIGNLEHLLEVDRVLKTTGREPRLVMERLIIRICS
jgi:DNA polymerase III delta subunit